MTKSEKYRDVEGERGSEKQINRERENIEVNGCECKGEVGSEAGV